MTADITYLARFLGASIEHLATFAAQSARLDDLARAHPVAFVALATEYGDAARRSLAIRAVIEGRRLRTVCDLAAIPYCLRSVPPEHCPFPLPPADWSADASPLLANFIPENSTALASWVPAVFFANGAAGEPFAVWIASRHELFTAATLEHRRLLPLALYVWFSRHPQYELHHLLPDRWSARTGTARLLKATRAWLNRIICRTHLPGGNGVARQIFPAFDGTLSVIELTDYRLLLAEQRAMNNCLDRYGRRIASGTHRIFSLRTPTNASAATFEVAMNGPNGPALSEIKGPSNEPVSVNIALAVEAWVKGLSLTLVIPELRQQIAVTPEDRTAQADECFAGLLEPYVAAHAAALRHCGPITLRGLENDLQEVAVKVGITSWPVRFEGTFRT